MPYINGFPVLSNLHQWFSLNREHAWKALCLVTVREKMIERVTTLWKRGSRGSNNVLSVHIRGTDKDEGIGGTSFSSVQFSYTFNKNYGI